MSDKPQLKDKAAEENLRKAQAEQARAIYEKRKGQELDKLLDGAIERLDKNKPKGVADRLRDAKTLARDGTIEDIDIPNSRKRFGIPAPNHPLKRYGGWKDHSGNTIDLYRGDSAKEKPGDLDQKAKPIFFNILERTSANAQAVEKQNKNLEAAPKGKATDLALILSVVSHEGQAAIGSSPKPLDSFGVGGLDLFFQEQKRLKSDGYLPADFPPTKLGNGGTGWEGKWAGHVYNELGVKKADAKEQVLLRLERGASTDEACKDLKYLEKKPTSQEINSWKKAYGDNGRQWQALLPFEKKTRGLPCRDSTKSNAGGLWGHIKSTI